MPALQRLVHISVQIGRQSPDVCFPHASFLRGGIKDFQAHKSSSFVVETNDQWKVIVTHDDPYKSYFEFSSLRPPLSPQFFCYSLVDMGSLKDVMQLTPEEDEEACIYAMQLSGGSVLPMALKAATELQILETIVKAGPAAELSPADIAAQLPTENPGKAAVMVDRILRLLSAFRVVSCTVKDGDDGRPSRKYAAAPVCKYLTKNEDGVSVAALNLLNQDKVLMECWYYLKDAVLEGGIPFNKAYGMTAFEYPSTDARFNQVFNEGMRSHSTIFTKKLLQNYRGFDDVKVLVDVGGGTGATLHMITSEHPHIKGINFDLPHVISDAPPCPGPPINRHGNNSSIELVGLHCRRYVDCRCRARQWRHV
ncbi:hypothetical protein BHM03_00030722 [Ensete ventricosum]|nr:hypothetical protein BHM03_00030722 [Ensete ventricosum]